MKKVEMPKMGDSMEEGKILRWLKKEGDLVKKGEFLAEVETDKVNIEIEAFASGLLRKIVVPEGASALVGAEIALIGAADEPLPGNSGGNGTTTHAIGASSTHNGQGTKEVAAASAATAVTSPRVITTGKEGRIFISPLARRLAEEYQLNYATLQGTGPNGRIIKMDIEAALAQVQAGITVAPIPVTQPAVAIPASTTPAQEPMLCSSHCR